MRKKLLSIMLSLVMALTIMPMMGSVAFADGNLEQLAAPTGLKAYSGVIQWNDDPKADDNYRIVVYDADNADQAVIEDHGYLGPSEKGIHYYFSYGELTLGHHYYFTVQSMGDGETYSDSEIATSGVFEYKGNWSNLRWDGTTAKWDPYEGAANYKVFICKGEYEQFDDGFVSDNGGCSFNAKKWMILNGSGDYTFYVVPYIDGEWRNLHASEDSPVNSFIAPEPDLKKPTGLSWDGYLIKWNPVEDATEYAVRLYKNGEPFRDNIGVGSDTTCDIFGVINDGGAGTYTFAVKAINGAYSGEWSDVSPTAYEYEGIPKPENLRWRGKTAAWDSVNGATDYKITIYKDGEEIVSGKAPTNQLDVSPIMTGKGAGEYTFSVCAGVDIDSSHYYSQYAESPVYKYSGVPCTHSLKEVPMQKASLEADGVKAYYECETCGELFEDAEGTIPTSLIDCKIPQVTDVTLSKTAFTYNGAVQTPGVAVKAGDAELVKDTDYTVSLSAGRKNVGTYKVTVNFTGNYEGSKAVSYKINPKGAAIKTPKKAKTNVTVKWAKQTAKMSTARITGYQVQIAKNNKFTSGVKTVNVKGYKKTSKKISKLSRKTQYYVRVRTYMGGYYSPWSAVKAVKTK